MRTTLPGLLLENNEWHEYVQALNSLPFGSDVQCRSQARGNREFCGRKNIYPLWRGGMYKPKAEQTTEADRQTKKNHSDRSEILILLKLILPRQRLCNSPQSPVVDFDGEVDTLLGSYDVGILYAISTQTSDRNPYRSF